MKRFMTSENCNGCLWQGCCEFAAPCNFFTPADDLDDSEITFQIEMGREAYRREYARYVAEIEGEV